MKTKGLTIIELMIIVAIIGIIAAIILPRIRDYKLGNRKTSSPPTEMVAPTAVPATPASAASQ